MKWEQGQRRIWKKLYTWYEKAAAQGDNYSIDKLKELKK